ncbi:MAG: hypothetical protein ACI9UJ_002630 [bacterium]|jgi:uncharacterized protein YdeI (YjbR/CyaY-like superfamily)
MNPEVDSLISNLKNWKAEFTALRVLLVECGLDETIKWRNPCFTSEDKKIVMIGGFKALDGGFAKN